MPSISVSCLFRLGLYREAEKQFKSALKQQDMVDTVLYLAKVSHKFDYFKKEVKFQALPEKTIHQNK